MSSTLRRTALSLAFAAAAMAVAAEAAAGDAKGPACADFAGAASISYSLTDTPAEAVAAISFDLAAPSCPDWAYRLHVLDRSGHRELARQSIPGDGSQRLTLSVAVPGDPVIPPTGVCVFTSVTKGDRVSDVAPDVGCAPAQLTTAGHGDHTWD